VEGRAETVRAAVGELSELLLGQDPRRIEDLWQTMTKAAFYRGGPVLSSAVAGIDQALWDILGHSLGVPVHQLLGGRCGDRVRVYGWIGGDEPAELADAAAAQVEAGLTAVKMNASGRIGRLPTAAETGRRGVPGWPRCARCWRGPGRRGGLPRPVHRAAARRVIPLLAPLHPLFVEEQVLPGVRAPAGRRRGRLPGPGGLRGAAVSPARTSCPRWPPGSPWCSRTSRTPAGSPRVRRIAALAEAYDATCSPPTARWGRLRWRRACRWPSPRRTS